MKKKVITLVLIACMVPVGEWGECNGCQGRFWGQNYIKLAEL